MAVLSSLCSVLAVCCSLVGLVVDLRAECMGELFCGAAALLTQVVALSEVLAQVLVIAVVLLGTVCITEMAEVVVPAQVFKQLVIIEVTVITELAERVSSVTGVVRVSMRSVTCQFLTVVPFTLMGEDLEMLCAELAAEELVLLPHVLLQLLELGEDLRL